MKQAQRGVRMTKEVVASLTADGKAQPDQLDSALAEFDLNFSIKKKMAEKNMAAEDAAAGLDPQQLAAVIRKSDQGQAVA